MTRSSLKPPLMMPGKYKVMTAESKTGIILTVDGNYHTGSGQVFRIFNSKNDAEEFCKNQLLVNSEKEFIIYDWKRKRLGCFNPYDLK